MGEIIKVKTADLQEWKELRSNYIGGSDAAAVVGLNPYSSAFSLWAEKTGRISGFEGNLATEVGTFLEDFVAQKFAQVTGKKVRKCNLSILNSDYPFAIANIDREIVGEDAGLEIKTTDTLNLKKFKGGEYPENYYVQMVHYMAVTGKKRWYLAVLIGNKEFKWFVLERDESEIEALMKAEADFWEYVKRDVPPEPDGLKATSDALKCLYEYSDDAVVDLFLHTSDIDQYIALGKQIKALEQARNKAANRVKAFMADAGGGECEQYFVSWQSGVRRTFDADRFAADNPEIDLSDYYNETITRTFRVTERKGA